MDQKPNSEWSRWGWVKKTTDEGVSVNWGMESECSSSLEEVEQRMESIDRAWKEQFDTNDDYYELKTESPPLTQENHD